MNHTYVTLNSSKFLEIVKEKKCFNDILELQILLVSCVKFLEDISES